MAIVSSRFEPCCLLLVMSFVSRDWVMSSSDRILILSARNLGIQMLVIHNAAQVETIPSHEGKNMALIVRKGQLLIIMNIAARNDLLDLPILLFTVCVLSVNTVDDPMV